MKSSGVWLVVVVLILLMIFVAAAYAAPPQTTVTWTAPTTNTDSTVISGPITYQLYVGASGQEVAYGKPVSASPYVLANPAPVPGSNVCAQITAIVAGVESARTLETCVKIPLPVPSPPGKVTITSSSLTVN